MTMRTHLPPGFTSSSTSFTLWPDGASLPTNRLPHNEPMNRRRFLATALTSGAAAASPSALGQFLNAPRHGLPGTLKERYDKCDAILQQPVFKRDLFKD